MTSPSTPEFDDLPELMLAVAAGAASAEERARAEALLAAGDPAAREAADEADEVLAELSRSLAPVAPPADLRRRLLGRIDGSGEAPEKRHATETSTTSTTSTSTSTSMSIPEPDASAEPPPAPLRFRRGLPWALAGGALAAGLTAAAALSWAAGRDQRHQSEVAVLRQALEAEREEVAAQRAYLRLLESDRSMFASLGESLAAPGLQVVRLAGTPEQPAAGGRLLFDAERGRSYFYGRDLAPAGAGRDYQLWYVTDAGDKVSLGTFDADPAGRAVLALDFDPVTAGVTLAAVTDEPAGGVPQPTGSFQLLGRVPLNPRTVEVLGRKTSTVRGLPPASELEAEAEPEEDAGIQFADGLEVAGVEAGFELVVEGVADAGDEAEVLDEVEVGPQRHALDAVEEPLVVAGAVDVERLGAAAVLREQRNLLRQLVGGAARAWIRKMPAERSHLPGVQLTPRKGTPTVAERSSLKKRV